MSPKLWVKHSAQEKNFQAVTFKEGFLILAIFSSDWLPPITPFWQQSAQLNFSGSCRHTVHLKTLSTQNKGLFEMVGLVHRLANHLNLKGQRRDGTAQLFACPSQAQTLRESKSQLCPVPGKGSSGGRKSTGVTRQHQMCPSIVPAGLNSCSGAAANIHTVAVRQLCVVQDHPDLREGRGRPLAVAWKCLRTQ